MYQAEALLEMNRVSKIGARLLITGKNDNYYDDDEAAKAAEIGARNKNHPNYFTDVKKLVRNISKLGFAIEIRKFYRKRGDLVNGFSTEKMPDQFYEYLFVLKKIAESVVTDDFLLAHKESKTFKRREGGD